MILKIFLLYLRNNDYFCYLFLISDIEFSIPPSVIPLLIDISPSTPPIPPTYPPSLIPSISSSSHLTSSKPKPVLNRSTQINKITTS